MCTFTPGERMLSEKIRHLTAFQSMIRWRAGKQWKTCCRFPQLQSLASLAIPPYQVLPLVSRSTFCDVLCLFLPSDELCRASQVLVGLRLQLPDSHLLGQSMLDVQKWLPPLHLGKEVEQINGSMMICLKGLMRKQSHRFLPCIFMYQG